MKTKVRHEDLKTFSREAFKGTWFFQDIVEIKKINPFIAASTKAFQITCARNLNDFQRAEVESIIYRWFKVGTHFQNQGIICWQEGALLLSVF